MLDFRRLRSVVSLTGVAMMSVVLGCGAESRNDELGEGGPWSTDGAGEHDGDHDDGDDGDGGIKYDVDEGDGNGGGDDDGDGPLSCEEVAEMQTNQGCEFWAVDLPQAWWIEGGGPHTPEDAAYAVAVANASSNLDAEVEIFRGAETTPVQNASVPVGGLHLFELPPLSIESQASSTGGTAYRIETSVPVTAYQFNTLEQETSKFSADASLLFPTHVLAGDYTTFTGDSFYHDSAFGGSMGEIGAFIAVVGVEDGTTVDVFATADLMPGAPSQDVTIDRGEVYAVLSLSEGNKEPTPGEGNLTGSRIVADKKVAVFSGNVATREPVGVLVCCADHLEQQMLPLEAWGQRYLTAPPVDPAGDTNVKTAYRMVGGEDGISLTYAPAMPDGAPTVLDAYEVAYFVSDQAFTVEGSRPFGVAQFHVGSSETAHGIDGDPAMVVLPAQDQLQDAYVFLVPPTYTSNYVSVLRPVGTTTTLDGATVEEPASPVGQVGGTTYEFVQVPVDEGAHRIAGDEPFEILVYGYAETASYAYPGGSGLEHISEPPPPPQG
jgi:hypothetical protein